MPCLPARVAGGTVPAGAADLARRPQGQPAFLCPRFEAGVWAGLLQCLSTLFLGPEAHTQWDGASVSGPSPGGEAMLWFSVGHGHKEGRPTTVGQLESRVQGFG